MKYSACIWHFAAILFISIFFFSACSKLTTRISERPGDLKALFEARDLISDLKNQNFKLKTFKGVGSITFFENGKKHPATRAAWVGSVPGRLRMALRSVSGQPIVSFASDSQWMYLVHHTRRKFYKQRAKSSTMKRLISIPIHSDDIVDLLAGHIPVDSYDSAWVKKNSASLRIHDRVSNRPSAQLSRKEPSGHEDGYILFLKKGWGDVREKIYLDADKKYVHMVEFFDLTGNLKYRAEFKKMQDIKEYRVPSRLVFSTHDGFGFQLDVDRYWADVLVSPAMFVLTPPE